MPTLDKIVLKDEKSWAEACEAAHADLNDAELDGSPSKDFPSINAALAQFLKDKKRQPLDNAIRRQMRSKMKKSDPKFPDLLGWLIYQLDNLAPPKAYDLPPLAKNVIPQPMVNAMNAMRLYSCEDAVEFAANIYEGMTSQVFNRMWAAGRDDARGQAPMMMANKVPYQQKTLNSVKDIVVKGRRAVCTTFAMTAAAILTEGTRPSKKGYRIETVAAPNHCFVLMNRADDDKPLNKGVLPKATEWGKNVIIVDPWAGSLGHPIFYDSKTMFSDYPWKVYIDGVLKQTYDSEQPDPK